jgi:hypothetical protein
MFEDEQTSNLPEIPGTSARSKAENMASCAPRSASLACYSRKEINKVPCQASLVRRPPIQHPVSKPRVGEEALRFLTPVFNVYWNLEIDAPYFEIKSNDDDAVTQLAQITRAGMLRDFKNIAIDWNLWLWEMATYTMEFKVTFGDRFKDYEHPSVSSCLTICSGL